MNTDDPTPSQVLNRMAEYEKLLNEANADRQRLRDALTQAGAGQFLDTISATLPPPVVAKADADDLANALGEANADRHRLREVLKPLVKMDDLMNDESWDEGGTYSGAYYAYYKGNSKKWAAAKESLTTPPPPVVAKADADALINTLQEAQVKIGKDTKPNFIDIAISKYKFKYGNATNKESN
jgi:hypothetical protein